MIRWMWCLLVAGAGLSQAQGASNPRLQNVNYSTTGSGFQLQLEFDQPYDSSQATIELINHTVQLSLPRATYDARKTVQKIQDQKIKSIYTYQAETELIRSRIIYFPQHKSQELAGKVKIESKDNVVLVSVVDSSVATPVKSAESVPVIPPNDLDSELARALESTAMEATAADIVANDMGPLVDTTKINGKVDTTGLTEDKIPVLAAGKTPSSKAADSSNYWRMGASLLIILIFAGALMVGSKYWTRHKVGVPDQTKIRVITQHHLGPKKTLAIIQVAGESILIGVTDQSISLIKTLALLDEEVPADTPTSFAKELNRAGIGEDEVVDRSSVRRTVASARKPEDEEAALGRIQSQITDRLREMRSL